ncbi:Integrase zinc binding domain [Popillia japonica]|uniref:RNA-directed DNA polymerase n=1 Tax=Popillia japonica TaxID=7064 RepID=A0AAW1HVB9_POPJA
MSKKCMKLLKYKFTFEYIPGKNIHIADALSRSYLKEIVNDNLEYNEVVHIVEKHLNITLNKKQQLQEATIKNKDLSLLTTNVKTSWPNYNKIPNALKVYSQYKNEISFENNLPFLNDRLIVPKSLVKDMLKLVHESHMGITKTIKRVKCNLYWPNMAQDIENEIRKCKIWEKFQRRNIKEPMKPLKIPGLPFEKIATDILYKRIWRQIATDILEFGGKFYLVIIDYFSKWLDILMLKGKTSDDVIDEFKRIFATHGIPKEIVSDNMPFNSVKCRTVAEKWDIKITTSSPHYPKSNGLAEKAVGIAKNFLRKSNDLKLTLLEYRNIPITELGLSPAQVLMSRSLRTKIPVCDRKLKQVLMSRSLRTKIPVCDRKLKPKKNNNKVYHQRKF